MPTHDSLHTHWCVIAESQTHTEALGPEQWHATPQDVYVISRVCQKLFGVAVETQCNIQLPLFPLFLPVASLSPEKKLSVRESQASSPTLAAAARLAAMIHGKDRMYGNNMKVDQVSSGLCSGFKRDQHELQMNPFVFQVAVTDTKCQSPGEEEMRALPNGSNSRWDFFMSSPESRSYSQKRNPSSPHNDKKGIRSPCQENRRGPFPHVGPSSPFLSSTSFPSSPLASPFRLFEGAQRHQTSSGVPVSPALSGRGCSLTETSQGLR